MAGLDPAIQHLERIAPGRERPGASVKPLYKQLATADRRSDMNADPL
jgi:hypothetical protein